MGQMAVRRPCSRMSAGVSALASSTAYWGHQVRLNACCDCPRRFSTLDGRTTTVMCLCGVPVAGAGKSTLLGLLSQPPSQLTRASTQHTPAPQRTRRGQALVITGQVRSPCADGPAQSVPAPHKAAVRSAQEKAQPHCSKPIVCLIAQHDLLLPALTTRETLQWMQQMSAAGRGAARPGPAALAAETSALLDRLGLNSSSETQVRAWL